MRFPITIGVHRSFFLVFAVVFVHVAAAAILFLPVWPVWLTVCCIFLFLVSAVFSWWQCQSAIEVLRLLADGRLECCCRGDRQFSEAQLLPGAMVHPLLTVIRLQCKGKTHAVVLLPDSAPAEDRRRLRVWLRWRASFATLDSV
ncbi:MAG: hypothetical protein BWY57_00849 [Betaproteobacteria bacterium ADurb.Bin341]|nr:MAG: hypothetical protein BWY57_00849 [Betaproteobacteria bacterium ADurb.Bin341]